MHTEKKIIKKQPNELFMFDTFFKKLTGVELEDIPEKYKDYVLETQKKVKDNTELVIFYKCENIETMDEDSVTLESGVKYTGELLPRILKNSKQVVTCLIALKGYEELRSDKDDVTTQYFLDAWGSAYVESAQAWLGNYIECLLESEGKMRTHLWSPGQHKFDLSNQRAIFDLLQPEAEGCGLTDSYMMTPIKSGSGFWGVTDIGTKEMLLPCDFCKCAEKCPTVKIGCAET